MNRPSSAPLPSDAGLARTAVAGMAALIVLVLGSAGAVALHGSSSTSAAGGKPGSSPGASPSADAPEAISLSPASGTVSWSKPLTFSVSAGTLSSVSVRGPGGAAVAGAITGTSWASTATLVPGRTYTVSAHILNSKGKPQTLTSSYLASPADKTLHATISPRDGAVVGVAEPVIVRFDQKVSGVANRTLVLRHLLVQTTPHVNGAWRWYNSYEVHWRPASYFKSGTKINVAANLGLVHLADTGTWGSTKVRTTAYKIGLDYESTVDIAKHIMVVRLDGRVIRIIKVSTGRDMYPTKGGVHIVLTREKKHIYNSGTVGIPTDGPGGYYETLPWSMRISNGGAFVHANPATVGAQGRRNVSHGCVNTSVADAMWFYYHSQLGDPVNIINAVVKPVQSDAGMFDWNYSYADWSKGNL